MAKILREDIEKWNAQCKNGFKIDLQYYLNHNEKTLEKIVVLDDETYLKAHLMFYDKYENFKHIGYYINLNVSKWHHKKNDFFACSSGFGVNLKVNDLIYSRRNLKELQKATEKITDNIIFALAENKQIDNGIIL